MARSVHFSQEWDFAVYGAVDIAWNDDEGADTISDISTGIYRHATSAADSLTHPGSTLMTTVPVANTAHPSFAAYLTTLIAARHAVPTMLAVTYSNATNRYTIATTGAAFAVTWSGAAQLLMRKLLGFSGNLSGATSYTGDVAPFFTLEPRRVAYSQPQPLSAVADSASMGRTGSGLITRVGPQVTPYGTTWRVEAELDSQVLDEFAVSPGYTWQTFFNDAGRYARRCYFVDDSPPSGSTQRWCFQLMHGEFDASTHRRAVANMRNQWAVDVEGSVLGRY